MAAAMATTRDPASRLETFDYDSFTTKCENYLSPNPRAAQKIKCFLNSLYGVVKETETAEGLPSGDTLPELIVDNFDEEQIWQEIELQNEARIDFLVGSVAKLVAQKDKLMSISLKNDLSNTVASDDDLEEGEGEEIDDEGEEDIDDEEGEEDIGDEEGEEDIDDEEGEEDIDDEEGEEDIDDEEREGYEVDDDENINDEDDERSKRDQDLGDDLEDDVLLAKIKRKIDKDFQDNDQDENDDFDDGDEEDLNLGGGDSEEDEFDEEQVDVDKEDGDYSDVQESRKKDPQKPRKSCKPSAVDDTFFKLSEMEEFLEKEEQEKFSDSDDSGEEESVDLFGDIPSDESDEDDETDKKQPSYSDFFDAPDQRVQSEDESSSRQRTKSVEKKKVKFDFGESDSDDSQKDTSADGADTSQQVLSSYELRQKRLQAKIQRLEEEAISEKPWQLKGEISKNYRPENALLEEALEFDSSRRPAPVITEETTERLEDIIKRRIKDKAWDDVVRKVKPVEAPSEFKKQLVLDQEKSKLSLAEVYEQEYLKKVSAADPDLADKPDEVPAEHVAITKMVDSLFRKLEALSNFHFTPKQAAPEVKIITNLPAISMEEVAPVATTDATLLAPEEVKARPHGDVKSQAEKTAMDRNHDRRLKKKHQRLVAREREKREATVAKLRPGLGNKYSKEKAVKMLEKISKDSNVHLIDSSNNKQMKSSSAFFSQLQDEVSSQFRGKNEASKKRKIDSKSLSAKRLKL